MWGTGDGDDDNDGSEGCGVGGSSDCEHDYGDYRGGSDVCNAGGVAHDDLQIRIV